MTDITAAHAALYLETFAEIAKTYPTPRPTAHGVGDRFRRIGGYLQLLARDHPEHFQSFEYSCLVRSISPPPGKLALGLAERLALCSFDVEAHLRALRHWLETEPNGMVLDLDGLHLFLQTARRGRRRFLKAGFQPESFVAQAYIDQATICTMALGGFKVPAVDWLYPPGLLRPLPTSRAPQ